MTVTTERIKEHSHQPSAATYRGVSAVLMLIGTGLMGIVVGTLSKNILLGLFSYFGLFLLFMGHARYISTK